MSTAIQIPCCLCGTLILPNAANQCSTCLAQQFNLKDLLQMKSGEPLVIHQCRQCRRFARTDTVYEYAEPESPELLSICLKHIPALVHTKSTSAKLHIVDAMWVWTEPHSMRLKVRVKIRTELESVQIQQRVMVEFIVQWKQCKDCNREFTSRTWQALVQLRQKRDDGAPRKGLATLEMALARNKDIRKNVLKIDSCRHGLDFYFLSLPQAQAFASFLARIAPMRTKTSQKLVSTDSHNNTAHLKHTLTADMVPLCRDDLILVAKEARGVLSGRLGLVLRVSSGIKIIDASPKRKPDFEVMDLSAEAYYKTGADKCFPIFHTAERMIRFVVLDVELLDQYYAENGEDAHGLYSGPTSQVQKYAMAEVSVARESDMGQNDLVYNCVTHLGNLIQPGDVVLGYDLESSSADTMSTKSSLGVVDLTELLHNHVVIPDVVLVKKLVSAAEMASREHAGDALFDAPEQDTVMQGKKRVSKRKLRRRQKHDKKQRELEETAARMGFVQEDVADGEFEQHLSEDPDLAADLLAVEGELETFHQAIQQEELHPSAETNGFSHSD